MSTVRRTVDLADAGDAFLANAAALGDRAAFEVVVHRYGPMLYRYSRRMLANDHDAPDAHHHHGLDHISPHRG